MITVRGLSFSKSEKSILDSVSFTIQSGQICSLNGKSGSGKSLLLSLIAGDIRHYDGDIIFNEKNASRTELQSKTFLFPGKVSVNTSDLVRNVVVSARAPYKKIFQPITPLDWQIADMYISVLGLSPHASVEAESLSDGLFKKVLLAFAMARETPLLLLDNPAEGLDPSGVFDLERGLKRYTENGNSVIMTTHDLNFSSRISDQIILMQEGSVLCDGNYTILTEENIRKCFEMDCVVNQNVYNGKPEVLFVPQL